VAFGLSIYLPENARTSVLETTEIKHFEGGIWYVLKSPWKYHVVSLVLTFNNMAMPLVLG
jgi:hypothetical protein